MPPERAAPAGAGLPAAVLWDMDGLLVDSEPLWWEVELAVMRRLGGDWTAADQRACLGGTLTGTADYLLRRAGSDLPAATVLDWMLTGMRDRLHAGVPLRPGAAALLDTLGAAGVPCALVSSSYRVLVDAALDGLGRHRFAVSVAGDEVRHGKPDPECYRTAARLLGVAAERCVVLEDSETGSRAGMAAGCPTLCVPSLAPVAAAPGRWVRASLEGLSVADLATLVQSSAAGPAAAPVPTASSGNGGGVPPKAGQRA